MIFSAEPYVMLMASLPAIPRLTGQPPPINSARLFERLKMLEPEDREELDRLNAILSWNRIDTGDDDAAFVERAERVIASVRDADLRETAAERLEIRTVVAALRRRRAGEEAPPADIRWGFGRYVDRIRTNWSAPDFGVAPFFPWVNAARDRLEARDAAGLERLLLDVSWAIVVRHEPGHEFDLPAVAFYLMRWSLAERWARYDADAAAQRFAELLDAAFEDGARRKEAA